MRIRAPAAMRNRAGAETSCHAPLLQAKPPANERTAPPPNVAACKACSEDRPDRRWCWQEAVQSSGRRRSPRTANLSGKPRRRRRRGSPAKRAAPGRGCRDRALRPWRAELRGQKVKVAFVLTPEPESGRINSARTSLVFESQYLDRLDARRAGEEFVGLCH